MIVHNVDGPEAQATNYIAHRGAIARMVLTSHYMQAIEFLAYAMLPAGNTIEEHVDAVEEIYFMLSGTGIMKVGDEEQEVKPGDATWLPAGVPHALINNGTENIHILVVAAYPK